MGNLDKIIGKRRFEIFGELQKGRNVLKLIFLGKDYERLTIVTGVETENGIPYFLNTKPG